MMQPPNEPLIVTRGTHCGMKRNMRYDIVTEKYGKGQNLGAELERKK
jgi:hypothetical protein